MRLPANEYIFRWLMVSIPQKGLPPCGMATIIERLKAVLFQYRKRVSPHAALVRKYFIL